MVKTAPAEPPRPRLREGFGFLQELLEIIVLVLAIYTLVNLATSRYVVEGQSMFPTFEGDEYLIVNRFEYMFNDPQRGDIVIFHYPDNPSRDFIKRIVGVPGDTVRLERGQVIVNDEALYEPYIENFCRTGSCSEGEWTLGEDEFFVLGDNRNSSQDSTSFGPISRGEIVGRAWVKYWPPSEWDVIEHHNYNAYDIVPTPIPSPTPMPTLVPVTPEPPMFDSTG